MKNKFPKISVIVPVYNVEKYLNQCLDSILNQTFNDFEVICVNDGTKDLSREILEEYKEKDSRIIIIDKENGGLSSARNTGLKMAKGEFISFIDSDDWVSPDMLQEFYDNITKLNSDISICRVNLFDETSKEIKDNEKYFNLEVFDATFDNRVFSYKDTKSFIMEVSVMAWNKLYRKSFLEECKAQFEQGKIFEDGPFFFSIYFKTKRVSIVRKSLYFYRINRKGSILEKRGENLSDIIDIVNLMNEELKKTEIYDDVKYDFFMRKADDIIYRYSFLSSKYKRKYIKKLNKSSCLLNKKEFDYKYMINNMPIGIYYKRLRKLQGLQGIFDFYLEKIIVRLMYKIMQVLYTEENVYYLKLWNLKIRLKKYPDIFDVWYENDRIYCIFLKKIKFSFKFEYSNMIRLSEQNTTISPKGVSGIL